MIEKDSITKQIMKWEELKHKRSIKFWLLQLLAAPFVILTFTIILIIMIIYVPIEILVITPVRTIIAMLDKTST